MAITKQAQIEALTEELGQMALARAALVTQVTELLAENAALSEQLREALARLAALPAPKPPRPARVVPPDELERIERMRIAKAAAIASGKVTQA